MRKCMFLVVAMAMCSTAMAGPFRIHINPSGGVPYTVTPVTPLDEIGAPSPPSWMQQYETFCLEKTVYFSTGRYWATIDNAVYNGGNLPNTNPPVPVGTVLSDTVKKIYAAYRNNAFDSSGFDAGDIQTSIWNQRGYYVPVINPDAVANYVLALAPAGIAGWENVRALNLWGGTIASGIDYTKDHQSQLVMVPVPGAYLLGALGLGVANWRLRRRRLA